MSETTEYTNRKSLLSDQNVGMIHDDLRELIQALNQCNRYLDIFFLANGVYDKAADMFLLQLLEGNQMITETTG